MTVLSRNATGFVLYDELGLLALGEFSTSLNCIGLPVVQ